MHAGQAAASAADGAKAPDTRPEPWQPAPLKAQASGNMRPIPAHSTDLDANGSTGLCDFTRVASNFLEGGHDPSTDFDPCAGEPGVTSLGDLVVFAGPLLHGGTGAVCPSPSGGTAP